MASKTKMPAGAIIALIIIGVAIMVYTGVATKYTDGFAGMFQSFYVTYDGEKVKSDSDIILRRGDDVRFDCGYSLEFLSKTPPSGYGVRIVPANADANKFDFMCDGVPASFVHGKGDGNYDFAAAFGLKRYDNYFTLKSNPSDTIADLLQSAFPSAAIELTDAPPIAELVFSLIVSAHDDSKSVVINFRLQNIVTQITLPGGTVL